MQRAVKFLLKKSFITKKPIHQRRCGRSIKIREKLSTGLLAEEPQ